MGGDKALEIVYKLIDTFTCRVCNMVLTPDLLTCASGHAVCLTCKSFPSKCPACSKPLLHIPTPLLSGILQHLPRECRNNSCPDTVLPRDDHHHFCGYMNTNCQLCAWVGPRRDLSTHVYSHAEVPVIGEGLGEGTWEDFDPNVNGWKVWPLRIRGQFFWKFMRIELSKNVLIKEYFWVPNGTSSLRVRVKVEFKDKSGSINTSNSTFLKPSSSWNQSSINYALSNVKNFIDGMKVLRWTELYTVEDGETSFTPPSTPNCEKSFTPPTTPNNNKRPHVAGGVRVLPDLQGSMGN